MNIETILKDVKKPDVRELSSLSLAFIGDSVYELYVRTKILQGGSRPANELHKIAVSYVKAKAQSLAMHNILDGLTEEEVAVYKRGRNTHIHTVPKNADMNEYRQATGLEALVGYLYITGQTTRLDEILEAAFAAISRA